MLKIDITGYQDSRGYKPYGQDYWDFTVTSTTNNKTRTYYTMSQLGFRLDGRSVWTTYREACKQVRAYAKANGYDAIEVLNR
jgi:hypothetical protein